MNILPFVLTFLMLMGIAATTIFKGAASSALEERCIRGSFSSHRQMMSREAQRSFRKANRANRNHEKEHQKKSEKKSLKGRYTSHRDDKNIKEASKFTLAVDNQLLYEPAARLIKNLYGHAPFYTEGLEYQILDQILWTKERTNFLEPFPESEPLKTIYYKMLQGTNVYDTKTKNGYPPLSHFFSLEQTKISFYHASRPVLTAVLGEKLAQFVIAAEILASEQKGEKVAMGKAGFEALAQKYKESFDAANSSSIFLFSKSAQGKPEAIIDAGSGISTRH